MLLNVFYTVQDSPQQRTILLAVSVQGHLAARFAEVCAKSHCDIRMGNGAVLLLAMGRGLLGKGVWAP